MSYGKAMGDAIGALTLAVIIMAVLFVPMGIWKWIEIIIWLWRHVKIGWAE